MNPWLEIAVEGTRELASTSFGCALRVEETVRNAPLENITGCFVALAGIKSSVLIGIASERTACQLLAQAFLCEEQPLSPEDVNDALGEIANIVAGWVKRQVSEADPSIRLGLPLVMEGRLPPTEHQQVLHVDVAIKDIDAKLVLVCEANSDPSRSA